MIDTMPAIAMAGSAAFAALGVLYMRHQHANPSFTHVATHAAPQLKASHIDKLDRERLAGLPAHFRFGAANKAAAGDMAEAVEATEAEPAKYRGRRRKPRQNPLTRLRAAVAGFLAEVKQQIEEGQGTGWEESDLELIVTEMHEPAAMPKALPAPVAETPEETPEEAQEPTEDAPADDATTPAPIAPEQPAEPALEGEIIPAPKRDPLFSSGMTGWTLQRITDDNADIEARFAEAERSLDEAFDAYKRGADLAAKATAGAR